MVNRQGFSARDHYVPPPSNTAEGADTALGESNFTQVGLPDFKLVGRVTDDDSQPIAQGDVRANNGYHLGLYATTDADGRYELPGIARQRTVGVYINPPDGSDALPSTAMVTAASDEREKTLNVVLQRGLVLRGRIIDAATGQGVPAGLKIIPLPENDFVKRPDYTPQAITGEGSTDAEGRFEFRALPGPGVLMVSTTVGQTTIGGELRQTYMLARFSPADREKAKVQVDKDNGREWFHRDAKFIQFVMNENAVKYVDVTPQSASESLEIKVDRGKTVDLEFVDAAGQPLPGVLISGITEAWPITATLAESRCTVYAIGGDRPRLVAALHKERGLSAALTLTGDETSPVRVVLQASASLRGRAVDKAGVPIASTELSINFPETIRELHRFSDIAQPKPATDSEGRFHIENIIPGQRLSHLRGCQSAIPSRSLDQGAAGSHARSKC